MGRRLYPQPWGYRYGWLVLLLSALVVAAALAMAFASAGVR